MYSYRRYLGYHLLIILFIMIHYRNSPHSLFYIGNTNISLKTLNENNKLKVDSARSVINGLSVYKNHISDAQHTFVVMTTRRLADEFDKNGIGYLTRVLARLNLEIGKENLFKTKIIVCDVNSDIAVHNEAYALSKYFQTVHRFHDNDINPRISHSIKDPFRREGLDYSYCLRVALDDSSADYVTALEDDAVPERDMLWNLEFHVLARSDWYYAKTYHPLRWSGFAGDRESLYSLLVAGIAVAALHGVTMLVTVAVLRRVAGVTERDDGDVRLGTLAGVFFVHGLAFTCAVALLIGRANFDALTGAGVVTVTPAPRCSTPMVTYTRQAARQVSDYLGRVRCTPENPVDLVIAEFAENRTTLLLQPNQVRHIGYLSSIKGFTEHPEFFLDEV